MMTVILTALGGGVGSVLRVLLDGAIHRVNKTDVLLGTIVINVTGSFVLGLVTGLMLAQLMPDDLERIVGTGVIGGYTTFSTASVEGARYIEEGRRRLAVTQAISMAILSLLAGLAGLALARLFAS